MNSRNILLLAGICAAAATQAQDLNKEITIDRDIIPAQRAAARPVVFPSVTLPAAKNVDLAIDGKLTASGIAPELTLFSPAVTEPSFAATPWRGYVDLGYFPASDFGISAGYAILDTDATKLNVAVQADNRNFKSPSDPIWNGYKWRTTDLLGKISFRQRLFKRNYLNVALQATSATTSLPGLWNADDALYMPVCLTDYSDKNYYTVGLRGALSFDGSTVSGVSYGVGGFIGSRHNMKRMAMIDGLADKDHFDSRNFGFNAYLKGRVSPRATLGIRVEGQFIKYDRFQTSEMIFPYAFDMADAPADATVTEGENPDAATPLLSSRTLGQIDFIPAAEYNGGAFFTRIGARMGLSSNSGKSFHVAPDVLFGLNPDQRFGAWLKFGGSIDTNSPESLFALSRYADPRFAADFSNVAFTGQLGVRVGPFKGASLTVTADYAAANDWIMPLQILSEEESWNTWGAGRIRAWKVAAQLQWQYRDLVNLQLSYEGTLGSGCEKSWLYWRDRARQVVGASVSATPFKPLTLEVGISARLDRRQYVVKGVAVEKFINDQDYYESVITPKGDSYKLGDMTNLWAGASYRITPALTIFARFDNILNKRAQLIYNVPSQGFTGLFGAGYKF